MMLSFAAGTVCAWLAYRRDWIRRLLALPVSFFKAVPGDGNHHLCDLASQLELGRSPGLFFDVLPGGLYESTGRFGGGVR